ncbi:MAG TPA: D-aminoacylase [Planctomycetota bacterium]
MKPILILGLLLGARQEADVLLKNALIVDGTGAPAFQGDVAIRGGAIAGVGAWAGGAAKTIDATGLVVAPGFIDLHSHSDAPIVAAETRDNYNFTSQGCTTIVTGNCGGGTVDVGPMFDSLEKNGAGTNVIHLLPHGSIRSKVFGSVRRPPTDVELAKMKALVEKGMREGAWGMSTGLIYVPGTYAETDEITALAKVVHGFGGLYASHIRSEAKDLLESIREAIRIGEGSGCPVHVSHLKCSTKEAWGQMEAACGLIEAARARGQNVSADQYPYTASSTSLAAYTVPSWALEGGGLVKRLDDPADGPRIRAAIRENFEKRDGPDKIMVASFAKNADYNGKTLKAIAGEGDPVDTVVEILKAGGAQAIGFSMREEDMLLAMRKDWVATASDGSARRPGAHPHPRNFGTFPRKIGLYALEKKALTLEAAVRSSSGLPAEILGLKDRGVVKAGMKADLAVFDPERFIDRATFEKPNQYATGIRWVFVNGEAVIADGKKTDALPGKPLRLASTK